MADFRSNSPTLLAANDRVMSAGDLVSLAFRRSRLQWRSFLVSLLVPGLWLSLAYYCLVWLGSHSGGQLGILAAGAVVSVLLLLAGQYSAAPTLCAIILVLLNQAPDLEAARKALSSRTLAVVCLITPVAVLDLIEWVLFASICFLPAAGLDRTSAALFALIGVLAYYGLFIPIFTLIVCYFCFISAFFSEERQSNLSLTAIMGHSWELFSHAPGYAICSAFLLASAYFLVDTSTGFVVEIVDCAKYLAPDSAREVVAAVMLVVQAVLTAPVVAFLWSVNAVGSTLLYRQLGIRAEGWDLSSSLKRLM